MPAAWRDAYPFLFECLERANPRVKTVVEVLAPDVGLVLRRPDQWVGPERVSESPPGETAVRPDGSLGLAATAEQVSEFQTTETQHFDLGGENPQTLVHGLAWAPESTFERARLRSFSAHIKRVPIIGSVMPESRMELQVYRVTQVPGARLTTLPGGSIDEDPFRRYTFAPLFATPPVVYADDITWTGGSSDVAWVQWDLTNWATDIDDTPGVAGPRDTGELNRYLFVITPVDVSHYAGLFRWLIDSTLVPGGPTATVAGVGAFYESSWTRANENEMWTEDADYGVPSHRLSLDRYEVSGVGGGAGPAEVVYAIDMGAAPASGATGRIVFERATPTGTAAALAISTAGSGGPWTTVTHGDSPAVAQQTYHLRVRFTASPARRATPSVFALGVEYRTTIDVTEECVLTFPTRNTDVPWGPAEVAEGGLRVLRTGARDYYDPATRLGVSPGRLEADVYLAPDHPSATRADWMLLERALVTDRRPGETGETFTLLSRAARAKRTIPAKTESLAATHTVTSTDATLTRVRVGTTLLDTPYAAKNHYMRVASSASTAVPPGFVRPINASADDETGVPGDETLVFSAPLPGALAAGAVVEVHSGRYSRVAMTWTDVDPADAWWDVIDALGIPRELVGLAGLAYGGVPPTVAERAADVAVQAKLKISGRTNDDGESGWKLLGEFAALAFGATTEIAGQIVWVPRHAEHEPGAEAGAVTLPAAASAHVFGPDEYFNLDTPVNLERRTTVVSCTYGVNRAAADPNATPAQTVTVIDADALAAFDRPEMEVHGVTEVSADVARWVWNSADEGLELATRLAGATVRGGSTGLRLWSWGSANQLPHLVQGDVCTLLVDSYTDRDPASGAELRGWLAVRAILVGVEQGGRRFHGFIPGLSPNWVKAVAGNPGTQSGAGAAIAVPGDFDVTYVQTRTEDGALVSLKATFTPPATPFFLRMEYEVESSPNGTTGWTVPTLVAGTRAGPDRIPAEWDLVFRVTPYTVSSGGTRTAGAPVTKTVGANPEANPAYGTVVRTATYVEWPITLDQETREVRVWRLEQSGDPGPAHIEGASQTMGPLPDLVITAGDGQTAIRVDLTSATNHGKFTAVSFDRNLTRGQRHTDREAGDPLAAAPGAPTSPTFVSKTATSVTNSVVIAGGATATAFVRIYRDGTPVGTVAAAAAGATQSIQDAGPLDPSTTYVHRYSALSSTGVESALTATVTTATNAGTIAPPTGVSANRTGAFTIDVSWSPGTSGDGTPSGTKYYVQTSADGIGGWIDYDPDGTTSTSTSILSGDPYLRVQARHAHPGWSPGTSSVAGPV